MILERNIIARATALGWKSEHLGDEADSDAAFDWLCDRVGDFQAEREEANEIIGELKFQLSEARTGLDGYHDQVSELEGKLSVANDKHARLEEETKWSNGTISVGGMVISARFRGELHLSQEKAEPIEVRVGGGEPELEQ